MSEASTGFHDDDLGGFIGMEVGSIITCLPYPTYVSLHGQKHFLPSGFHDSTPTGNEICHSSYTK